MNEEIMLNQHGEETPVLKPETEMAFVNPSDFPDLEAAEIGFNIQAESFEFKNVGESLRAVFNGFALWTVKDQVNAGQYKQVQTAILQTKTGIKGNMGANLIKQLSLIPPGTSVQITYKGEQKTNNNRTVKSYEVVTLKVPRLNVIAPPQSAPLLPAPEKPVMLNTQRATEYWSLVYSPKFKFTEQDGLDHLAACNNDFTKAIEALGDPFGYEEVTGIKN